jgi:hypothetical protein
MMRVLQCATHRPIGYVDSAVMLNAKLRQRCVVIAGPRWGAAVMDTQPGVPLDGQHRLHVTCVVNGNWRGMCCGGRCRLSPNADGGVDESGRQPRLSPPLSPQRSSQDLLVSSILRHQVAPSPLRPWPIDGKIWMDGQMANGATPRSTMLNHTLHYGCGAV